MEVLEIRNVTYNYSNSKEKVLSSVNQKFELGKFYAIVGKSGTGKSTLLSLLAGLDNPKSGKILFQNEDIEKKTTEAKKVKSSLFYLGPTIKRYGLYRNTIFTEFPKDIVTDKLVSKVPLIKLLFIKTDKLSKSRKLLITKGTSINKAFNQVKEAIVNGI